MDLGISSLPDSIIYIRDRQVVRKRCSERVRDEIDEMTIERERGCYEKEGVKERGEDGVREMGE